MAKLKSRKLDSPVWPILLAMFVSIEASDILRERFGFGEWEALATVLGVGLLLVLAVRAVAYLRRRGQHEERDERDEHPQGVRD